MTVPRVAPTPHGAGLRVPAIFAPWDAGQRLVSHGGFAKMVAK